MYAIAAIAAIVGDITPYDGVSNEEKYKLEAGAIEQIRDTLGSDAFAGKRHTTHPSTSYTNRPIP